METIDLDPSIRLRYAEEDDVPLILEFIRGLAEYEGLLDRVEATREGLREALFEDRRAEALIGEYQGQPAGFALYFHTFSTFLGKPGIFVEDIFVKPELRGKGLGKLLLSFIARLAVEEGCGRLEWACLDWNEPSIAFYRRCGALPLDQWTTYRVTGEKLRELGRLSGS
jgi:GNAT superfamily N-acetyltransferase